MFRREMMVKRMQQQEQDNFALAGQQRAHYITEGEGL